MSENKNLTVGETFTFDEDELHVRTEGGENEYWVNVQDFYLKNKDKPVISMSEAQIDWLYKIEEVLDR